MTPVTEQATDQVTGNGSRYDRLIKRDRVHGSLYTDPAIFAEELHKIWYRSWVFVGHETEVAQPGDYVRKRLGLQDVIMTRDRDGVLHLLLNRCAHRGNQVCNDARGNASAFRCPYHGWTYRNDGELVGFPFFKGYGQRKLDLALGRVPRVDSYRGFVFGSFATEGPSLLEHLGAAAGEIDRLVRLSPGGRVELTAGWLQHRTQANWKLLAENETDGYHPQFVHGSIFGVTGSTDRPALQRCLHGGDPRPGQRPQRERSASGVPQVRRTDALVRHDRVPGARLRRVDASQVRRGSGTHPDRGRPACDGFPEPVHRRDPDLQYSTGHGR